MNVSVAMGSPRAILHYVGMGAGVMILFLIATLNTQIPVIWFERGVSFKLTPTHIDIEIEGRKPRECDPLLPLVDSILRDGVKVLRYKAMIRGSEGRWRETLLEFVEDDSPNSSRMASFEIQSLDTWRWYIPRGMVPPPKQVKMELLHLCGKDRDQTVKTVIGPITIPRGASN